MVREIKTEKEFNEIIKKDKVIIDFWAVWCMPCQIMGQMLAELSSEFKNIEIAKINIDDCPDLAEKFDVMSIPTLLFYKKGNIVERTSEALSMEELKEKMKRL